MAEDVHQRLDSTFCEVWSLPTPYAKHTKAIFAMKELFLCFLFVKVKILKVSFILCISNTDNKAFFCFFSVDIARTLVIFSSFRSLPLRQIFYRSQWLLPPDT